MEFILANPTEDQAEGLRRLLGQGSPHIITVVSGSMGAGKTSTVINLAVARAIGLSVPASQTLITRPATRGNEIGSPRETELSKTFPSWNFPV